MHRQIVLSGIILHKGIFKFVAVFALVAIGIYVWHRSARSQPSNVHRQGLEGSPQDRQGFRSET